MDAVAGPRGVLDPAAVLAADASPPTSARLVLGASRDGRPIHGYRFGRGRRRVSLIAGCHADEPVGPAMLGHLAAWLAGLGDDHPALETWSWSLVPHANPDGDAANRSWAQATVPTATPRGRAGVGYDLGRYLLEAVREAPGDDVEFGFPRGAEDAQARPENRAVAKFLRAAAPLDLHASFHGMAFAAGPWFLLEPAWADRTAAMRSRIREAVRALGYRLHDIDRRGDKGFTRIDEGFTTRPNAEAMVAHFRARGDDAMAARFRPSSMDYVRGLGGDPLTLVSEMPLFLVPPDVFEPSPVHPPALRDLHAAATRGGDALSRAAARAGVIPMPIDDQMHLQLVYLREAMAVVTAPGVSAPGVGAPG